MEFKLFKKLASLEGSELVLLLVAAAVFIALAAAVVVYTRKAGKDALPTAGMSRTRKLVFGALSVTLSFVLSYFKLFSMPFGGSITLVSMLPVILYASYFGPACGFTAAFAYSLLQVIQGPYIVHPIQFVLDYFVAFTCLGLASLFPQKLVLGAAVAGFARMLVSTVSGAIFFKDAGLDYGMLNPWAYSLVYNGLTLGVDTVLCMIVAALPPIKRAAGSLFKQ
jgi:thiamine transporter